MTYFLSKDADFFPAPDLADSEGLLAIGGNLSPETLITAYANGIFPWYSDEQPILWWSPDPRMVLFPNEFIRHKNLKKTVENGSFEVRFDTCFEEVITCCGFASRPGQDGTWITAEIKSAFLNLAQLGIAHSVETFQNNKLVGGLYGISLGNAFFGESMFFHVKDASKVALWHLVERLLTWDFKIIDVQQETGHLRSLGARTIPRSEFLILLEECMKYPTKQGKW